MTVIREPTTYNPNQPIWQWPTDPTHSCLQQIRESIFGVYKYCIAHIVQQFRRHNMLFASSVIGALLLEPLSAIQSGRDAHLGTTHTFQYHNLNPTELTPEQQTQTPTLLIHGKHSNQASWLPLVPQLNIGPTFTLNTSEGGHTQADIRLIHEKMAQIQALYDHFVPVNLVGYSQGAERAFYAALPSDTFHIENGRCYADAPWLNWNDNVNRIVRIGSPTNLAEYQRLSPDMHTNLFAVYGVYDVHMPERPLTDKCITVNCGHVGLPSHPDTAAYLNQLMMQ